ncbi:hypothetical protein KIF24_06490 [Micromonospora sp. Llam7]|uniref:aroma-sacti cluster domain-containing protein n=1 Tax=Micromonospora tarapacensis TaxID=2835305 RepID=UPI001C8387A2|nr:aroma-sacti cluster domain-containing protein [Micromonospora tarapacensis]MBX7265713.1 hypothetical protein [Micromonospora tarapacensis]
MADIAALRALGIAPDQLQPEYREVLESLTEDEVRVLSQLKQRMDSVGDVEGHGDGGVFW